MKIYDYKIKKLNSDEVIDLKDFKGKYILFVNVASKCGFTPQYEDLQDIYDKYKDKLVILGFPCNQFLWQENKGEDKIAEFCQINYGVTFPMTEKIKVKGSSKHPIYKWLTSKDLNGKRNNSVSWNFNKFLVSPDGELIDHFGSKTLPSAPEIIKQLK